MTVNCFFFICFGPCLKLYISCSPVLASDLLHELAAVRTGATFTTLYYMLYQIKASSTSTTQSQTSTNQKLMARCKSQLRWVRTRKPRPLQGISWLQPMDPCHKCAPSFALKTNAGTGTERKSVIMCSAVQECQTCCLAHAGQLTVVRSQASLLKQLPKASVQGEDVRGGVRTSILLLLAEAVAVHACLPACAEIAYSTWDRMWLPALPPTSSSS